MVNDSIDNLRLDINKPRVRASISIRKGDTKTRTIHITLASNGAVFSLENVIMAELLINKPDGTVCDQDMIIAKDELQYTFRTQDTNVEGECVCQLRLTFSDGAVLSSPEFSMYVYNMIQDSNTIKSQNEYSALVNALTEANDLRSYVTASYASITEMAEEVENSKDLVVEKADDVSDAADTVAADKATVESAVTSALAYKNAANTSATNASTSASNANTSATNAKASEDAALASKNSAANYASLAGEAKAAADTDATLASEAKTLAVAAKNVAQVCATSAHEDHVAADACKVAAAASEAAATVSEANAASSEANALAYKNAANASKIAAASSEANALTYEQQCNDHETNCQSYANAASASKTAAKTSEDNSKDSENWCKYYYEHMSTEGSLVLGTSHTTAYYGDLGKTAYDHSQLTSGNPHNVTYTEVGADQAGSAASALTSAKSYTDTAISNLINGAPETLDTLKEIADAFTTDHEVVTALNTAIGTKATKTELTTHTGDTTVHVSTTEKNAWNAKAETTAASTSAAGLMSAADKEKLDGIASGANNYVHPSHTAKTSGLYNITVDSLGHVTAATAVSKTDITALGIPASNTQRAYYCTCDTNGGTAEKTIVCADSNFVLEVGTIILVTFTKSNTATNTTFNVNNTGALPIRVYNATYEEASSVYGGKSGRQTMYMYDGTGWAYMGKNWDDNVKNTAGSTAVSSSKLFLIGAKEQSENPQTYSRDTCYIGTDGCLYSGSKKVFAPTEVTGSLEANATQLTISDSAITTSSTVEVFTSVFGVNPTNIAVEAGKVTLTFSSSHEAATIKIRIS